MTNILPVRVTETFLVAFAFLMACALSSDALARGARARLQGRLAAVSQAEPLASGKAKFESRGNRLKFSAEAEDLVVTNAILVLVNGQLVGGAVVDAFGVADLNLDSALGDNVPTMRAGDMVDILDADTGAILLSGVLSGR